MTRKDLATAIGLAIAAGGCSSSEDATNPIQCGTGTVLVGHRCEVVDASAGGSAGASGTGGSVGQGGGGGTDVDSGTDVGVDAPTSACPTGLPGPALVEVSTPNGDRYCIDATEVPVSSYRDFLSSKQIGSSTYDMSGQPSGCEQNVSYSDPGDCTKIGDNDPVGCVDWCDAFKYCEWAGKRLCGEVGGGNLPEAEYLDPDKAEWFNACSGGGKYDYPYGDTYEPTTCPTQDWPGEKPIAVGSASGCHGVEAPFSSIYDMSGNLTEWINACVGTTCQTMDVGIAFMLDEDHQCGYLDGPADRYVRGKTIGFRCCADTQ